MKKLFTTFTIISILLFLFGCDKAPTIDTSTWTDDFEGAKVAAQKGGKEILLLIGTGDENPQNAPELGYPEFRKDVLFSEEFVSAMTKKYVLVNLDYNETLFQNVFGGEDEEAEKKLVDALKYANIYACDHLPAVSILSAEGFIETQFYLDEEETLPKNVDEFYALINSYNEDILLAKALIEATKKGSVEERIAAMDDFYEVTRPDVRGTTIEMSRKIVELDKDNKTGLVPKHLFAIADTEFYNALYENNPKAALKAVEKICENKNLLPDDKQQLYFSYAYLLAQSGYPDYEEIKYYFQKAYDVAPNSEHAPQVKTFLEFVTNLIEGNDLAPEAVENEKE